MLSDLMIRLRALFRRNEVEEELDSELSSHFEHAVEKLVRAGASREEAMRLARLEFGGFDQVKEECRDARGVRLVETVVQDARYGVRMLRKNPGFTAVTVLTLALGIGANTAIFSVVHAILLEPLPYAEPDRLVMIWNQYGNGRADSSPPDYFDRVEQSKLLESIAAFRFSSFNLTGQGDPVRLEGARVTASFFRTLGVAPLRGRVFLPEEDSPGSDAVVVLSDGSWKRRFGGDPGAIGTEIRLNDRPFTVVGVMPPRFSLLFPNVEVWAPIAFPATAKSDENRGNEYLSVVGRMKPGVSLAQTREEMAAIAAHVLDTVPSRRGFLVKGKWSAAVVPMREQYVGDLRPVVLVLFGAVLLVMLIACSNVANMLLALGASRVRELTLRAALGAGRGRIVRQLLVENLSLSLAGGLLGVLLAWWSVRFLSGVGADFSPLVAQASPSAPVLIFAFCLMLLTGVLFGLAPAVRLSRLDLQEGLKDGSRAAGTTERQGSRKFLVVSEVALALVLLVAAGLLIRSFHRLADVHPGFEAANRLTFRVSLPASRYIQPNQLLAFHQQALERLRGLPGVLGAGMISSLPVAGTTDTATIFVDGYQASPGGENLSCEYRTISRGYLGAMGVPLLRGRDFQETDALDRPLVVLVDERAALRFWPNQDPVGKRLGFGPAKWREVVGVVGSVRNKGLDVPGQEQVYIPYQQDPVSESFYVIHTQGSPESLVEAVRAQLRSVDASLPLFDARTMEDRLEGSMTPRRLSAALLAGFAALALMLAAIGIHGVIAFSVRQRTREIGIRMALGAQRGEIFRLIVGQGMSLAVLGLAMGVIGAAAATRLLERLLFGVTPYDPRTFLTAVLLLAGVALLACYFPARRAMKGDPMIALRYE